MRYNLEMRQSRPETALKAILKTLKRDPSEVEEVEVGAGGVRLRFAVRTGIRAPMMTPVASPTPPLTRRGVDYFHMPPRHFAQES